MAKDLTPRMLAGLRLQTVMRVLPRTVVELARSLRERRGKGERTLLDRDVVDETRDDRSGLRLSDVNRLDVERVGVRVKLDWIQQAISQVLSVRSQRTHHQ